MLGGVFAFVGYSCLPPTVVFLAASQPEQRILAVELVSAISPCRVIFLLSEGVGIGVYNHDDFSRNNLRMGKDEDWRKIVHLLIDMSPIIVVDTRVATPPVSEEVIRIISTNSFGKTLCVVGSHGESPALDQAMQSASSTDSLTRIPAEQVVSVVRGIVKRRH